MKKTDQGHAYYPVSLNICGKKCVIIGGGQVALRKIKLLLEYGASIKVISPKPCRELIELSKQEQIQLSNRDYSPGDLQKAFIAIAAANDTAVNQQVLQEARDKGILINIADDPENSDFIVPSQLRRGDMTISVSTAGISPALARKIRTKIEKDFGDEYAALVTLVGEVRAEAKQQGLQISSDRWQKALDIDLMIDLLKKGNTEQARAALRDNLNIERKT